MKGDFARVTFNAALHYSHVFQQQGRVLLEADWNEQAAIQLHLLRTLAADLVGSCWAAGKGFGITTTDSSGKPQQLGDWQLSAGHFYVDGILCENDAVRTLAQQPPCPPTPDDGSGTAGSSFQNATVPCALWLDVWERHLSWIEAPPILDSALNGVDTCSRAQVVWQLRMLDQQQADQLLNAIADALTNRLNAPGLTSSENASLTAESGVLQNLIKADAAGPTLDQIAAAFTGNPDQPHAVCIGLRELFNARRDLVSPRLSAQLPQPNSDPDPCILAADARYRGCENQLYRVEIHQGTAPVVGGNVATVLDPAGAAITDPNVVATFKWSRENGSVIFMVKAWTQPGTPDANGNGTMTVALASPGRDDRLGLAEGDWVELVDDDYTLAQRAYPLLQIANLDTTKCTVTLTVPTSNNPQPFKCDTTLHPLLRRWDQRQTESVNLTTGGVIEVTEGKAIDLEDGIQVTFQQGGLYATGDYWVIPARVAGGGTLDNWPLGPDGNPAMLPARGVHHYAVLGTVDANNPNNVSTFSECCCRVPSLCSRLSNRNSTNQSATASDAVTAPPSAKADVTTPAQPAAAVLKPPSAGTLPAMTTIKTPAATAMATPAAAVAAPAAVTINAPAAALPAMPAATVVAAPSKTSATTRTKTRKARSKDAPSKS